MTRTFCVRGYSSLPDDDATGKMEHVKLMLESAIADYQEHMYDFTVKGNKAAGTRARRSLLVRTSPRVITIQSVRAAPRSDPWVLVPMFRR